MIAAGYTQSEITQELEGFAEKIQDSRHRLTKIPLIGWLASLFWSGNLMKADTLEEWMRNLLAQKGISTFSDLIVTNDDAEPNSKSVKLHLVVADITRSYFCMLHVSYIAQTAYDTLT